MGTTMCEGILTERSERHLQHRLRKGVQAAIIGCLSIGMLLPGSISAEERQISATASDLKAAYIFNFVRFTDWPTLRDKSNGSLRLNVLNDQKIFDTLYLLSQEKSGQEMGLEVQSCLEDECLKQSSIIFIGKAEDIEYKKLLRFLNGNAVLTISDIPGFSRNGGMIEISQDGNRMTFTINLDTVKKSDLYVSAQLLQLANIIRGDRLQFAIVDGDR